MKWTTFIIATLIGLFTPTVHSGNLPTKSVRVINFSMSKALDCTKSANVEKCLQDMFGKDIGFEVVDGKQLREVSFPKIYNVDFKINGTFFNALSRPKISFEPKLGYYVVCGLREPIQLKSFLMLNSSSCACGFDDSGKFDLHLDTEHSFIPSGTKVKIRRAQCSGNKTLATSHLELLQPLNTCGYDFPKGTEFTDTIEGVEFVAPADGSIDMGDETNLGVWKGSKYVNRATKEQPCKWRDATPDPPQNPDEK